MSYPNPIAIPINGGWRYNYGNMFYVQLVTQYLVTTEFDDDTVQAIMDVKTQSDSVSQFGGFGGGAG